MDEWIGNTSFENSLQLSAREPSPPSPGNMKRGIHLDTDGRTVIAEESVAIRKRVLSCADHRPFFWGILLTVLSHVSSNQHEMSTISSFHVRGVLHLFYSIELLECIHDMKEGFLSLGYMQFLPPNCSLISWPRLPRWLPVQTHWAMGFVHSVSHAA